MIIMEIETMIIYLLSSSPMCSSMSMLKDGLRVMCGTSSNDSSPTTVSWWSIRDENEHSRMINLPETQN